MGKYNIVMHETEAGLDHQIADHIIKGGATTPFELMMYGLASCNVLVLKNLLTVNRIEFAVSRVECTGETDPKTSKAAMLRVEIYVRVDEADKPKVQRLATQIPKFCTVARSLDPSIPVEETVVFE